MIVSFRDAEAERIWNGVFSRRLPNQIQAVARRKLRMLNNARCLADLRAPPNNRLEALAGDDFDLRALISAEYALDDGLAAIALAGQKGILKVLIRP